MDIGAGLAQAGEAVGKLAGDSAILAQKDAAEQAKIKLMDELTTVREAKGREQAHGYEMEKVGVEQKFQGEQKGLDRTSHEKVAGITAGAHVTAAKLAADANRYHTDSQERIAKLNAESAEKRTEMTTGSREKVAEANRDALANRLAMTQLPPDAVNNLADQFIETGKTPSVGARNTIAQVQIQARVAEKLKTPTAEFPNGRTIEDIRPNWATADAAKKDLDNQTKMLGQLSAFSETLHKNIAGLVDLKDGLGPTAIPALDKWIQGGRRAIGDPDVDALDLQLRAITTEAAKLTSNQLGIAGLPEGARNDYNAILNSFKNWETIERVISTIEADSYNRLSSTQSAINNANERIKTGQPSTMPRPEVPGATPNNPRALTVLPYGDDGKVDLSKVKPNVEYSSKLGTVILNPKTNQLELKKK